VMNMKELHHAASLMGVSPELLKDALTYRTISSGRDQFRKKLTQQGAEQSRDGFAKIVYKLVFEWINQKINNDIDTVHTTEPVHVSHIGVLDIFGFEVFANNSLEQLCINYANEALHQQFSMHVYKGEMLEYECERIECDVTFEDNQDVLDLLCNKFFRILDDQGRILDGTDRQQSTSCLLKLISFNAKMVLRFIVGLFSKRIPK